MRGAWAIDLVAISPKIVQRLALKLRRYTMTAVDAVRSVR
jgi:hypothetical protein